MEMTRTAVLMPDAGASPHNKREQRAASGGGLASWALAGPASAQLAGRACSHHASAGTHASASGQLAAPDF